MQHLVGGRALSVQCPNIACHLSHPKRRDDWCSKIDECGLAELVQMFHYAANTRWRVLALPETTDIQGRARMGLVV